MISRCPSRASSVPARARSSVNDRAVLATKMSNQPPMCSAGTVTCSARSSTDRSCQKASRAGWDRNSAHHGQTFSTAGCRLGGSASRCGCGSAIMRDQLAEQLRVAGAPAELAQCLDHGHLGAPRLHRVPGGRAALGVPRRGVVVGRGHRRGDRLHRRARGHARPLHEAQVGRPVAADVAVAPRLAQQPGHGVGAVVGLVQHRHELPAGPPGAPAVLVHHRVARLDQGEHVRHQPVGQQLRAGPCRRAAGPAGSARG